MATTKTATKTATTTATKSKAEQLRGMDIKLIKMGQAQLGWDDAFYREVLSSHFGGKTSATDLTWQERQQLIGHMKRLGFVVKSKGTKNPRVDRADDTMSKLRAMWFAMAEVGAVHKPGTVADADVAIEAWAKRMAPELVAIRFASRYQMQRLIEAMKKWAKRVGAPLEDEQGAERT